VSRSSSRDLALVATFAAVVAALGVLPGVYPFGIPVPVTAQSLGVMLAGSLVGARRGFLSVALLLVLVALGLPLLAGGRGGLAVFASPSVGFLLGWPVAAFVIGWLTERGGAPYRLAWGVAANVVGGIVVLYALGTLGMMWRLHLGVGAALALNGWYVVGDTAKVVLASVVARGVHAAYPGLLHARREREPSAA
jgi:biotin transport system substrate-specific component